MVSKSRLPPLERLELERRRGDLGKRWPTASRRAAGHAARCLTRSAAMDLRVQMRTSQTAGSGCIMRLPPEALWAYPDEDAAERLAADSSRTTHGAQECLDACRLLRRVLVRALAGQPKDAMLLGDAERFAGAASIEAIARGSVPWPPRIGHPRLGLRGGEPGGGAVVLLGERELREGRAAGAQPGPRRRHDGGRVREGGRCVLRAGAHPGAMAEATGDARDHPDVGRGAVSQLRGAATAPPAQPSS